jgi:2-keto-4-pentenoate hydratase/2-oxohepta-3-ene-1,7-dioic acid hydratase in catechol pathway
VQIASYQREDGTTSFGAVDGHTILDSSDDFRQRFPTARDMLAADALAQFKSASNRFRKLDAGSVHLLAPIPNPQKIICIGLNYKTHIEETGRETPTFPSVFTRYPSSLVGSGCSLIRPQASSSFDFEGELAFVIGKQGRHIERAKAWQYVAGFSCFNDGSIRDFQRHTSQFWSGKNFDASGSFGPWLVTLDEVQNVDQQRLETRLNGVTVQSTSIGDLLFDIPHLIAYLSKITTLCVGDVVASGTPSGVGLFRKPKLWMKPGDTVEVEISRVGTLTNTIVQEQ